MFSDLRNLCKKGDFYAVYKADCLYLQKRNKC
jgi:hypothetical protein